MDSHHDHKHHSSHEHNHHHNHSNSNKKALLFSLIITFIFMIVEVIGGFISGSLALISDSIHMLADVTALSTALWATSFSLKKANDLKSYGYKRIEIIVGLINALILVSISFLILKEGVERLFNPTTINSNQLILVSIIGLIVNIISALIMYSGAKNSINMRGAFLHIISDLLGSLGVIAAGLIIYFTGWVYADPIVSILISLLILSSVINLIKESFDILMEGTPKNLNLNQIINRLEQLDNVSNVHDLHVWCLSENEILLTAHIVIDDNLISESKETIIKVKKILHHDFKIEHSTLELESVNCNESCKINQ